MTPKQLAEVLRIRRRREERALAALNRARAMESQARGGLAAARGALADFDARLQASVDAFHARAKMGIDPNAAMGMRGFHADQMQVREGFFEPIHLAEDAVAMAEQATAQAREHWRRASQAAENLQDLGEETAQRLRRDAERRQEQDRDEIAATRAASRFATE